MDFIKKLWNGDCSLALTYWVFYVVGNGIITLIDTTLDGSGFYDRLIIQEQLFFFFAIAIFVLCYFIFTSVGVWRSSVKYGESGGSKFWGGAAQVAVAIGALLTIFIILSAF